ncbi:MAG: peptidylprolyl isomerase [Bacillota bacterium]|nr:peptidylprolyl isomerase [Bacillota bacterium]
MKKVLTTIMCLLLTISMLAGCTVVYVADVGTVNGEKVPIGQFKYVLGLAEIAFGVADKESAGTYVGMYDSITYKYINKDLTKLVSEAGKAETGKTIWEKKLKDGKTVEEDLKDLIYNKVVELKVVSLKAKEKGITLDATEKETITSAKSNIIDSLGSKTKFNEGLKDIGITETELGDLWTSISLADKLAKAKSVTDEEAKKYYTDNYMRVKHILLMVDGKKIADMKTAKEKAAEVLSKLNAGGDFEKLMAEYTGDVNAQGQVNGGAEGYVFKSGDFGNPAFENAAAALKVGEYTKEPVEVSSSYQGYHIIKRYELSQSYYDQNTNGIKEIIKSAAGEAAFASELAGWVKEDKIVKNEGKIKGVKMAVESTKTPKSKSSSTASKSAATGSTGSASSTSAKSSTAKTK